MIKNKIHFFLKKLKILWLITQLHIKKEYKKIKKNQTKSKKELKNEVLNMWVRKYKNGEGLIKLINQLKPLIKLPNK